MTSHARAALICALACGAARGQSEPVAAEPVSVDYDFTWDIAPRFVQAGCASAECHGGATGRGGMKLSLFGTDPRADYAAIVEELEGRRIDRRDPARSLILRKPTRDLEHGGGLRWEEDDEAVRVVREWIAAGAPFRAREPFVPVRLSIELETRAEGTAVHARAFDAAGHARDATERASFLSSDPGRFEIRRGGELELLADRGAGWIFARLGQLDARATLRFDTARADEVRARDPRAPAPATDLDRRWHVLLAELALEPAPRADPHTLARRLYLDLCGRFPTPAELHAFLARGEATRVKEVARELLAGGEFAARFARFWDDWLERRPAARGGAPSPVASLDALARAALREGGRSAFLRGKSDPRDRAEHFARAFLGQRLECARCHNHPADRWKQSDHLAFSALFVDPRPDGSDGRFFDPANGDPVAPRFLGEADGAGERAIDSAALATWLLGSQRERFAENAANRLAAFALGRGLVEPLGDHRTTNPPLDEDLLRLLRERLIASGFDARDALLWIVSSEIYQRASAAGTPEQESALAVRTSRVFTGEELTYALCRALDAPLPEESSAEAPLSRELELLQGDVVDRALDAPGNLLDALAELGGSPEEILDELFLALLTRPPRPAERALFLPRFAAGARRIDALREIARAVILTREFGAHR